MMMITGKGPVLEEHVVGEGVEALARVVVEEVCLEVDDTLLELVRQVVAPDELLLATISK